LVLADLAGGEWPEQARQAAVGLSASAQETNPIGSLLMDIFMLFTLDKVKRMTTRALVEGLNSFGSRPWNDLVKRKQGSDLWLASQLRPYGVRSKNLRVGDQILKGYLFDDFLDVFRWYLPESEVDGLRVVEDEEVEG